MYGLSRVWSGSSRTVGVVVPHAIFVVDLAMDVLCTECVSCPNSKVFAKMFFFLFSPAFEFTESV